MEERHSGVGGSSSGSGTGDRPARWATKAYDDAEKNFGDGVSQARRGSRPRSTLSSRPATHMIKNARERIAEIFNELPASLQALGGRGADEVRRPARCASRRGDATRDNFNKDLVQRSSAGGRRRARRDRRAAQEGGGPDRPDRERDQPLHRRSGQVHHRRACSNSSASRRRRSGRWWRRSRRSSATSPTTR